MIYIYIYDLSDGSAVFVVAAIKVVCRKPACSKRIVSNSSQQMVSMMHSPELQIPTEDSLISKLAGEKGKK